MATIAFDTLAYMKALRAAGFTEAQADALANAQSQAFAQMLDNRELATKADIARLDARLTGELATMEARLTKSFHNALYGFAAVIIAAIAVAVAILK